MIYYFTPPGVTRINFEPLTHYNPRVPLNISYDIFNNLSLVSNRGMPVRD